MTSLADEHVTMQEHDGDLGPSFEPFCNGGGCQGFVGGLMGGLLAEEPPFVYVLGLRVAHVMFCTWVWHRANGSIFKVTAMNSGRRPKKLCIPSIFPRPDSRKVTGKYPQQYNQYHQQQQ